MKPPILKTFDGIVVVRDDLLPGGTKSRVVGSVLKRPISIEGFDFSSNTSSEFVYASPACGYAQLAIALACKERGLKATVFTAARKERHRITLATMEAGAKVIELPNGRQSNLTAKARRYAGEVGAVLLPFGLDCQEMLDGLASVANGLPVEPQEVWTVAGSGTLTRALQRAWTKAAFHAVRIGCKTSNIGRAVEHIAEEDFSEDAKEPPPFPSCLNYDAKAWTFILKYAKPGALFWNVAR